MKAVRNRVGQTHSARNPKGLVEVVYGINQQSLEVECVSVSRDGTLSRVELHRHNSARDVETEVSLFFNLRSLLRLTPGANLERDPAVQQLQQRAQELRDARSQKK